jgi:hypothetical protein
LQSTENHHATLADISRGFGLHRRSKVVPRKSHHKALYAHQNALLLRERNLRSLIRLLGIRRRDSYEEIRAFHNRAVCAEVPNDEVKHIWMDKIDKALAPHLKDRGDISWEYHIVETERMLWKIDSIVPPGNGTLAEKRWAREGRATEYAAEENVRSKL